MRLSVFAATFVALGFLTFLILYFGPAWRESRAHAREERLRKLAFERAKDLLTLITYDPQVAELVLAGLKTWTPNRPGGGRRATYPLE